MPGNHDLWIYIMLVSLFIGFYGSSISLPYFIPDSHFNDKTPVWAWILGNVSIILMIFGLVLLIRLSGVRIFNWDYIRSVFS